MSIFRHIERETNNWFKPIFMFLKIVFYLNLIAIFLLSIPLWHNDDFGAMDPRFLRTLLIVIIIEFILLFYMVFIK